MEVYTVDDRMQGIDVLQACACDECPFARPLEEGDEDVEGRSGVRAGQQVRGGGGEPAQHQRRGGVDDLRQCTGPRQMVARSRLVAGRGNLRQTCGGLGKLGIEPAARNRRQVSTGRIQPDGGRLGGVDHARDQRIRRDALAPLEFAAQCAGERGQNHLAPARFGALGQLPDRRHAQAGVGDGAACAAAPVERRMRDGILDG